MNFIEYTSPVNRIFERFYGQTNRNPTNLMREVISPTATQQFAKELGKNARLYLVKYRCTPDDSRTLDRLPTYKTLAANNENELHERLNQILEEIKKFAHYQDAKIVS